MHEAGDLGFGPLSTPLFLWQEFAPLLVGLSLGSMVLHSTGIGPDKKDNNVSILRFLEYPGRMAELCQANGR